MLKNKTRVCASMIAIISHLDCILHDAGEYHPECPERAIVIQEALKRYPFKIPLTFFEAPMATAEQLMRVHDKNYVDWLFSIAPKDALICIDNDTWMNPYTLNAARRAAASVPYAVDLLMQDKASVGFCNVRPPGHHTTRNQAMGFCFFNNVAVGVMHALEKYHLERIAIIDFDVHQGNGTQAIFQNNRAVLYCSSFEHPLYPGYEKKFDNEHILCIPLSAGTKGDIFRKKIQECWLEQIAAYRPQLIFFSAGFDAHTDDPLANIHLVKADYVWLTMEIAKIAKNHCGGRMISVLEGGYNLKVLAHCVPAHVQAMI
jgi:acetoin utilization deacetylase AcuC-like enzyme